jgi:hypothetical protein
VPFGTSVVCTTHRALVVGSLRHRSYRTLDDNPSLVVANPGPDPNLEVSMAVDVDAMVAALCTDGQLAHPVLSVPFQSAGDSASAFPPGLTAPPPAVTLALRVRLFPQCGIGSGICGISNFQRIGRNSEIAFILCRDFVGGMRRNRPEPEIFSPIALLTVQRGRTNPILDLVDQRTRICGSRGSGKLRTVVYKQRDGGGTEEG